VVEAGSARAGLEDAVLADQPAGAAQLGRVLEGEEVARGARRAPQPRRQLEAVAGLEGGPAGRLAGGEELLPGAPAGHQRAGPPHPLAPAFQGGVEPEHRTGGPRERGAVRRPTLQRLQAGDGIAGPLDGLAGGDRHLLGDAHVAAEDRDHGDHAGRTSAQLDAGVLGVVGGLVDQGEPLGQRCGAEGAGAPEQLARGAQLRPGGGPLASRLDAHDRRAGHHQCPQPEQPTSLHPRPLSVVAVRWHRDGRRSRPSRSVQADRHYRCFQSSRRRIHGRGLTGSYPLLTRAAHHPVLPPGGRLA
jgi:hypothetical protein